MELLALLFAQALDERELLKMVVKIIFIALIFWLFWFLIGYAKVPEPFNKVLRVVVMVVAVIFLCYFLLDLANMF